MIFVDTNYFLRFLLQDVSSQMIEAKQLFLKSAKGEVSLATSIVVFFEVAWVLRKSFSKDKQALINSLMKVLDLKVELAERSILIENIDLFKISNLSLEDCYNIVFARKQGMKTFKTFDRRLGKEFEKIVGKKKTKNSIIKI